MATSVAPMHFGCDSHLSKSSRGSVRSADDTAAIAAVGAGKRSRHVAVATYDKKCALDTLARILGLRAGLRTTNISSYLFHHKEVAAAVAKAEAERSARRRVTADRILEEYARIAFADMRDFVDWGPNRFELRMPGSDWQGGAVARVVPPGNGKPGSIRLHDKHAALVFLARHTGLLGLNRTTQPTDHRQANRDARAILLERLKRLKTTGGSQS